MKTYLIAGLKIGLTYVYKDFLDNNIEKYETELKPDYVIESRLVKAIEPLEHPYMQDTYRRFYQDEQFLTIQVVNPEGLVKYQIKHTQNYDDTLVEMVESLAKKPSEMEYIFLSMIFLDIAILNGFVPLHASCIIKENEAYLFSAPSGTGKSTHAGFYKETFKAFNLNDDKPIIKGNLVYGTPFSGKTSENVNQSYPVKAIYFLEQSSLDSIERLTVDEASKKLLRNIARPSTQAMWEAVLPNINQLLFQIPFYQTRLTLNPNSVFMTYYEPNKETTMKIKSGFIIKTIGTRFMVLPVEAQALHFNGIMTLNKSGKLLFEALEKEQSLESLTQLLMDRYDVSLEDAKKDVILFIDKLKEKDLLC